MRATVDGSMTARSIPSTIQRRQASLDGGLRDGGSFMSGFSMVSIGVSSTSSFFSGGDERHGFRQEGATVVRSVCMCVLVGCKLTSCNSYISWWK